MSFVLRIFFSGLIAFVPSQDGREVTVLLLDARHGYHVSDGTALEPHRALLLARAGSCAGSCPDEDTVVAQHLFHDKSSQQAHDALAQAVHDGGAWQLVGADLTVQTPAGAGALPPLVLERTGRRVEQGGPSAVPTSPREREDFSWVADVDQIYPQGGGIDTRVLGAEPPCGLIAARLRLRSGRVFTYRMVQVDGNVEPIHFLPLDGAGPEVPYRQAVASWVAAEVQVPGSSVELVEEAFGGGRRRSMTLSPDSNGVVEVALLNLPPLELPAQSSAQDHPGPGKHFELYFELAKTPPAKQLRPVPQVPSQSIQNAEPRIPWETLHPPVGSELLERLRLGTDRGPYDRVICPIGGFDGRSN